MDEEKDLETQELSNPEHEDSDSQDTAQPGETEAEKIAKLEEANKQLFARAKKAEEEAKTLKITREEKPLAAPQTDVDEIINKKFEERDLASLPVSDEIKGETRAYAKAKGIPIHEAAKSPYIEFLKTQEESKIREREASASTKGTGTTAKRDFSNLADEEIRNMDDESFTAYKAWLKSQE